MSEDRVACFAPIPAGSLTMGSDEGTDDDRPSRPVHAYAFDVSAHLVTVDSSAALVGHAGHPAPSLRVLPLVVTAHHEPQFRELAARPGLRHGIRPRAHSRCRAVGRG